MFTRIYTVYGQSDSGNCTKVKLALEQLRLPYRWVAVDPLKGETKSAEFLGRYPSVSAWLNRVRSQPGHVPL